MRVLFDNGVPRGVASGLPGHQVEEARDHGWNTLSNGGLLTAAEGRRRGPPDLRSVASAGDCFQTMVSSSLDELGMTLSLVEGSSSGCGTHVAPPLAEDAAWPYGR